MIDSRLNYILFEVFKSVKCESNPLYIQELIKVKKNRYDFRDSFSLVQPKKRTTNFGLRTFSYLGSKLWNDLDNGIKHELMSLKDTRPYAFKSILRKWAGPNYEDIANFYV